MLRNGPLLPIKGKCIPLIEGDVEASSLQESMSLPHNLPSLHIWTTRLEDAREFTWFEQRGEEVKVE